MVTVSYSLAARESNDPRPRRSDMVNTLGLLSVGQTALLERIPEPGDVMDLDTAGAILSRTEPHAYGSLVTMMNRGIVAADFVEAQHVDPEIVIRRI